MEKLYNYTLVLRYIETNTFQTKWVYEGGYKSIHHENEQLVYKGQNMELEQKAKQALETFPFM